MSSYGHICTCDRNADVVQTWRKTFRACDDVEIHQGDIFDSAADAVISPVIVSFANFYLSGGDL